jgi:tRNA(adenine34) deaminase
MKNVCDICGLPLEDCSCCGECSHICSLDYGEEFCPVCFPDQRPKEIEDRDIHFMRIALKLAENAFRNSEIPVGAVLVRDDIIVASAANTKEAACDPTAHAEIGVIREGAKKIGDWRLNDCTLYVTKEPCIMCAGAMINARLGRLVYGCRDERFGAVESRFQIIFDPGLNHKIPVRSGILGDRCAEILTKFFKSKRGG